MSSLLIFAFISGVSALVLLIYTTILRRELAKKQLEQTLYENIKHETHHHQKMKKRHQILLANIFKKAKMGIAVIDTNGKLVKFNKSFYTLLGYTKEEMTKKDFYSLFLSPSKEQILSESKNLFKTKKDIFNEYTLLTKEKIKKFCIGSSSMIKDENHNRLRLFILEDITKLKELENEQHHNNKIIAQQAKMAEMGEMIGSIAHQWRQPLNAINAAAMKLNFSSHFNTLDHQEIQEKTKFIEQQSIKMSETINDFMNFFKPSTIMDNFSIKDIYQKIYEFLEPQLLNREIHLKLICPENVTIYGYKNEFEHILLNIINNAKDAFETVEVKKKKISVVVKEKKNSTVIKIIDNAGGIPTAILSKIFNPFFTTKEQGKGTGIGLYMTKVIIEKHFGGTIRVQNDEDGAIFTLDFPRRVL